MNSLVKTTLIVTALLCIPGLSFGNDGGFIHGIVIPVDGEDYYLAGAPDGPDGEFDIPGHSWVILGKNRLAGKHYNTGPFGAEKWWSSDAADGELLYNVNAIIDTWSETKAIYYISKGFIHYHELVRVSDGELHPSKIVWLKHIARTSFTLDGGPHPELSHEVSPGLDLDFIPNALNPYDPGAMEMAEATVNSASVGRIIQLASKPDPLPGRGNGALGTVYVTSQGLYYDTFVSADSLPYKGRFQHLIPVPGEPSITQFGPGDPGYLGGRWWIDANGDGEMDPPGEGGDVYLLCPLLPPGRETP
jgi:selenium-binding protein 1